jgi:hypothetical protein
MESTDVPPYEPIDAEPTNRVREDVPDRSAASSAMSDRTKKAVAVAAVASFLTAMGAMAFTRSGDSGTGTAGVTTSTTAVSPRAGVDDTFQPRGAQPAAPTFGRGDDDDFGRDDVTASHGS